MIRVHREATSLTYLGGATVTPGKYAVEIIVPGVQLSHVRTTSQEVAISELNSVHMNVKDSVFLVGRDLGRVVETPV